MAEYVQQLSGFNNSPTVKYTTTPSTNGGVVVLNNFVFNRPLQVTGVSTNLYIADFNDFTEQPTVKYTSYLLTPTAVTVLSNVSFARPTQVTTVDTNLYIQQLGGTTQVATSRVQFWSDIY